MMLYNEELKEYLRHFPNIFVWKSINGKIEEHSSKMLFYQIEPLIDETSTIDVKYEFHTGLDIIQYLENDEIKNAFGIAIDIDTKGREQEVTVENLTLGKKIAVKLQKTFAAHGINTMLKFSGGGYHIIIIFSEDIIDATFTKKDMLKVIKSIIKETKLDKSIVKDVEIKGDKIRSLYSYNSKYGNYSILTDATIPAKEDIKRAKEYNKQELDFNNLITMKITNKNTLDEIEMQKQKNEKQKQFIDNLLLVGKAFEKLGINPKTVFDQKTGDVFPEIKTKVVDKLIEMTNKKPKEINEYILYFVKTEKNMGFYDKIVERGVKDGRKRLLFLVVGPYLALKYPGNKEKIKEELEKWLQKSGVSSNDLYSYSAEINSLVNGMEIGVRPTSIDSLLIRFGIDSKKEFLEQYVNGGTND
jgi:hypothetical protein